MVNRNPDGVDSINTVYYRRLPFPLFCRRWSFSGGVGNGSLNMQHSNIFLNFGATVTREVIASLGSYMISHTKLRDSLRFTLDGSKLIN